MLGSDSVYGTCAILIKSRFLTNCPQHTAHPRLIVQSNYELSGNKQHITLDNSIILKEAYGASHSTIAGIAQRFVTEGMESALGRKEQKNRHRKVTGDVEARICAIACSTPPEGASRWTMQAIAEELIRLEVVDYITDSTVCNVMKKTKLNRGL